MRTRRRLTLSVALLMLVSATLARAQQVLEQVPADALVVIKFKNLKATSDKFAKFFTDLGVAQFDPRFGDPLGAFEQHSKITAGLDKAGDAAIAFIDPDKSGGGEDSMIALLPVTDYQTFLGSFPDAKTEGEVSEVKIGDSSHPGYVANWGKFAALSPKKELVASKPSATLKLTAASSKEADAKDIILYANFPTIRAKVLPKLQQKRQELLTAVEDAVKQNSEMAQFSTVAKAVVARFLDVAEGFMTDTDAATFGLNLTGDGLAFTTMADFKPDSYAGQTVAGLQKINTGDLMLNGLPQAKYLMYGGGKNDPAVTNKLIDDFTKPILAELDKVGDEKSKAIATYITSLKKQVGAATGQTFGMVAPTGNLGQEPIFQFVNIMSGDVKALRSSYSDMMKTQEEVMKAFAGQAAAEMAKTSVTPNAKTIDGVSFDQIQTKFNMEAAGPEAKQAEMMMTYMYGPGGVNVLVGDVSDKLIVALGVPDTVLSGAITAVKSNAAPLADDARVKAVAGGLPKTHTGVFFVAIDEIVATGITYAKQFGMPVPVQLPPDLPPVGISVGTEGSVIRADAYIPNSLVQSLVAAGMQAAMQMQGGGGPGKGGGL
jgi:hypothetical protein